MDVAFWLVSDLYIKMLWFLVRQAKEFIVLKCLVYIFVQVVIEKCVVQSILVEANLHQLFSCSQTQLFEQYYTFPEF